MPTPKGGKSWNSGTSKGWSDKRGYRWIYVTENGRRRAKREHRHVMEEHLGRRLSPEEVVHHKDGDPSNNSLENLQVMPFGLHTSEHHKGTKHAEQTRITQAVIAEYREENKRLNLLKDEMLEALRAIAKQWPDSSAAKTARATIAKAESRNV